jgi:hypothetical protein
MFSKVINANGTKLLNESGVGVFDERPIEHDNW